MSTNDSDIKDKSNNNNYLDNKSKNSPDNNDNDKNATISIKRSTFTKIIVVGVIGLMFASFFAGFTIRSIPLAGRTPGESLGFPQGGFGMFLQSQ